MAQIPNTHFKAREQVGFRTYFDNHTWSEGFGTDQLRSIDPETGAEVFTPLAGTKLDGEFPSQWHRDAHVACLWRELAGCDHRIATAEADPNDPVNGEAWKAQFLVEQEAHRSGVVAELERLGEDVYGLETKTKRKR